MSDSSDFDDPPPPPREKAGGKLKGKNILLYFLISGRFRPPVSYQGLDETDSDF